MDHGVIMWFWSNYLANFAPFLDLIRPKMDLIRPKMDLIRPKMDLIRIMSVFFSIFWYFSILTVDMWLKLLSPEVYKQNF